MKPEKYIKLEPNLDQRLETNSESKRCSLFALKVANAKYPEKHEFQF